MHHIIVEKLADADVLVRSKFSSSAVSRRTGITPSQYRKSMLHMMPCFPPPQKT